MKIIKTILALFILSLSLTANTWAKKPEGKGNPHNNGPEARWRNSNKQSDESSLRGKARAEERHYLKQQKKHKDKKHKKHKYKQHRDYDDDDRYQRKHWEYKDSDDRYERQRRLEKYRNNPIRSIIDHNVEGAKAKIDRAHRQAIESIEQNTRPFSERPKQRTTKPWWSIFGNQEDQ